MGIAAVAGDGKRAGMNRTGYIAAFTALCLIAAVFWPAMPQPLSYHEFVDRRAFFGVANFLDAASNIGFVIPGVIGLIVTLGSRTAFSTDVERVPYVIFFLGMLLTSVGSSYYHLAPDNGRLFWDRLPMTIAFMSLIAAQICERISVRIGVASLAPMLVVGAGSVFYWRATERAGDGNVIPYGILQGYSVVILLLIAVLLPSRYTRERDVYWVFAWYVIAKILEALDRHIYALGNLVSGHTLKHLAAGAAGLVVCRMLLRRAPLISIDSAPTTITR
jgi:hypothetical protein